MQNLKGNKEVFPVGTQFALIEQAFLISDDGELILSPLILSVQLRAYLDVVRSVRDARPAATQCVAEIVMQPRELMKGNAVMKPLDPRDHRFEAGDEECQLSGGPYDPFETGDMPNTRLNICMRCHGGSAKTSAHSILTVDLRSSRRFFEEGSPEAIGKATSAKKRERHTWKTLHGLWRVDSAKIGTQSPARADQPQPLLDHQGSTTRAAEDVVAPVADAPPKITQLNLGKLTELIKQGADVNQQIGLCKLQGSPYFPLDAAAESWAYGNRARLLKFLLDRGAKVRGNEIVHAAFHPGSRQALTMVKTLLDAGADPNGKPGRPALTRAAFRGHQELVTLFLSAVSFQ
jgi:hypothetical protein